MRTCAGSISARDSPCENAKGLVSKTIPMALGPRLELRQSQSLVMTPQLQQAIKLLALSNLEVETFIAEALDANPLLELGEAAPAEPAEAVADNVRLTTPES